METKYLNVNLIKQWLVFVLLLAAGLQSAGCGRNQEISLDSATLLITNGTVIDGTGSDPIPNGFVAVQGDRILAVGRSVDFVIPDDLPVIDASSGTILPGIINSHSHKDSGAATRRSLFLLDGVTSVCDMMISLQMMLFKR